MLTPRAFKTELLSQIARVGKALGSGNRLELLDFLAQGERSVEDLAGMTGLSVAKASPHLRLLRNAGLVAARKAGQFVFYRVSCDAVLKLIAAQRAVAEENVAEVEKLVGEYLSHRDTLEPVPFGEMITRQREGLITVLDVRPREEYDQGHLPGAVNLPLPDIARRLNELPAKREIVAYCRGPYCLLSFDAVELLRRHGRDARRMQDGYPEWKSAGLPVETLPAAKPPKG